MTKIKTATGEWEKKSDTEKLKAFLQAEALKLENHTHEQAFRCPKCVIGDFIQDLLKKYEIH